MFKKLTGLGRFCIIAVIVAVLAVVGYYVLPKFGIGGQGEGNKQNQGSGLFSSKSDKYDAAIIDFFKESV